MKKLFTTAAVMLAAFSVSVAQTQVANGDFESWSSVNDGNGGYEDLSGTFVKSLNKLHELPAVVGGPGPITATKSTDVCGGSFSAQVTSKLFQGIFIPGAVGTFDISLAPPAAKLGKPYSDRPLKVKYCAKYNSVSGDSAEVFCKLTKWENGQRTIIGEGSIKHLTSIADFTNFEFTINYSSNATPDSVQLLAVASAGYNFTNLTQSVGQENSSLTIDNLQFDFTVGINEELAKETKIFPVPFTNELNIQLPEGVKATGYKMMDIAGRTIATGNFNGVSAVVSTSNLSTGSYFVELTDSKGVVLRRQVQKF